MITYYMTSKRSSEIGRWEKCKAATLTGAKREATAEYGAGYIDSVLAIAEGDNVTARRRVVASRSNAAGAKWANND